MAPTGMDLYAILFLLLPRIVFALVFVQTLYENLPVMSIKSREMSIDYRVSLLKLENDFSFIIDS